MTDSNVPDVLKILWTQYVDNFVDQIRNEVDKEIMGEYNMQRVIDGCHDRDILDKCAELVAKAPDPDDKMFIKAVDDASRIIDSIKSIYGQKIMDGCTEEESFQSAVNEIFTFGITYAMFQGAVAYLRSNWIVGDRFYEWYMKNYEM